MTAGLPGTGIGGLYYMLLTAWMPVREIGLTLRGRSSVARWREVLRHVALAWGIIGALLLTAWLIRAALTFGVSLGVLHDATYRQALAAGGVWSRFAAFVGLGILAGIVLGAALLRVVAGPRRLRPHRPRTTSPPSPVGGAESPVPAPSS